MGGRIEMLHRPNYEISSLFGNLRKYPSNVYDIFDDALKEHLSGTAVFPNNPYGSVNELGWYSYKGRSLQTNLAIRERLPHGQFRRPVRRDHGPRQRRGRL